jgi:2-oxoisovalerate dehydrogenase E1 component
MVEYNEMDLDTLRKLYRHMLTARHMDLVEQSYTSRGEAFFHVSGAGHEATVALHPYLTEADWLHCHYRDKALMLARGITPRMFFLSLFNKDESHSRGRQMNAHMSAPELNVLSIVGPVGNSALQAVGVAQSIRDQPERPFVLCALGEGTTQEGEVIEAIGQAVRAQAPVLFVVQDNAYAISTRTPGQTFYSYPGGEAPDFYGITIERIDGRDLVGSLQAFAPIVRGIRADRKPRIVVFSVERLHNHTNADDQRIYRTAEEITTAGATGDPLLRTRQVLIDRGITEEELHREEEEIIAFLKAEARRAQRSPEPQPFPDAKAPVPDSLLARDSEYRGSGETQLTMLEAIRAVLEHRMGMDDRITLFGEDLEDPKGDVFGITRGLSKLYPGRVVNSALSESLILGVSIGRALAGGRPVAFLQFADFLPIAYNQIFAELGSMFWRTDGGWQVPVIVMVTAGGYRPGLGPFHASTLEALATHTPGVDVFMPSTAGDAAGLLNAAFESQRPTIFFYPKNQLNDRAVATSRDMARHLVPLGTARYVRRGDDLTIVAYGNTVPLAAHAARTLHENGVEAEVIDLRSLFPWDSDLVVESVERTGHLLVTHEDNHTAGFGAEVVATVAERSRRAPIVRRVTRPDTYVPCNFGNQLEILPSYRGILETAVDMIGGSVIWKTTDLTDSGFYDVEAIGSSPSDESVTMVEWKVAPGDIVTEGDLLAEVEADKAAAELTAPVGGTVAELLIKTGDTVAVGTPIVRIRTAADEPEHIKPQTRETPGEPVISGLDRQRTVGHGYPGGPQPEDATLSADATAGNGDVRSVEIGRMRASSRPVQSPCLIRTVAATRGSRIVSNADITSMSPEWDPISIRKRTGIGSRPWVQEGETVLSLAVDAAEKALKASAVDPRSINVIIFATGTPSSTTPSMAALLQYELTREVGEFQCAAYDINAACSGYIYGLQQAYDYLSNAPTHRVLLVTSEVLSPRLNMRDAGTAPIFADAATATVLIGREDETVDLAVAEVLRPVVSAHGESGDALRVPQDSQMPVLMDGPKVYLEAVKAMMSTLSSAAEAEGIRVEGLDLYVPHQANQRIINAIRQRMKLPEEKMYSNIAENGNTSSSTIPLCLAELLPKTQDRPTRDGDSAHDPNDTSVADVSPGRIWGLTAFGGGFTYGAALLRVR